MTPTLKVRRLIVRVLCVSIVFPVFVALATAQTQEMTISAFTTSANWPLYIAKEGGYYEKYGLHVRLSFGIQPLPMAMLISDEATVTISTLDQAMLASMREPSLVAVGSFFRKSLYALMARPGIAGVKDLRGKKIGISQYSDSSYSYALKILEKYGLKPTDVEWAVIGTNARAAALVSGRVDATMLTAPSYFRLEQSGYKSLANMSDFDDVFTPSVTLLKRKSIAEHPGLAEQVIKAHTEAVKRFYDDKEFAVKSFLQYDPQERSDVERLYDQYVKTNAFERIPFIQSDAVRYTIQHQQDKRLVTEMKTFNFQTVFDRSLVERLVGDRYFESLFGAGILSEQKAKAKAAFH